MNPATPFGQAIQAPHAAQGQSPDSAKSARAREVAEDFEALFLAQMLAPMFAGLRTEGPFGGGSAEKTYRSLLVEEYGKAVARAGGVGIADAVQREILKLQEVK